MNLKAILTLLFLPLALAANEDDFRLKGSVGLKVFGGPLYEGTDRYIPYYFPQAEIEYGPFFANIMQGIGAFLPINESRSIILAPAIRWRVRRNLDGFDDTIDFLDNIRPVATLNTILKLDEWIFNFRITEGLAKDNLGGMYNLGIAWNSDITEKWNLGIYTTAIYGDRTYNMNYFGITPEEHMRFGYAEYIPGAGPKSLDIGWVLKYALNEKISFEWSFEYLRLVGVAARSPMAVTSNYFLIGAGVFYHF